MRTDANTEHAIREAWLQARQSVLTVMQDQNQPVHTLIVERALDAAWEEFQKNIYPPT